MICKQPLTVPSACRRGASLPFLAVSLVALTSALALGIDLSMLVVAKNEVQDAADLAALTAARSLSGDSTNNYNQSTATTNAQNILSYNTIVGQPITSSQLQLTWGSYDYNDNTQTFSTNFPPTAGKPTTAVTATVTTSGSPTAFGRIFGISLLSTVSATATAVHRPRDIALVVDLSGSMRLGTILGFDFGTPYRQTNNPDPLYPTFGHYSSNSALLQSTTSNRTSQFGNYTISPSNTTYPNASYSLTYINNFFQNAAYASPLVRAFDSYTSSDGGNTWTAPASGASPVLPPSTYATTPGGDVPLLKNNGNSYAQTVNDAVTGAARNQWWELDGYSGCTNGLFNNADLGTSTYASGSFNAYTQGPGYYGKTFFTWPPDPRRPLTSANDSATIYQFLQDFGYASNKDFNNTAFTDNLAAKISSTTQTSISVHSSNPFPVGSLPGTTFRILVDSEIMEVTNAVGTNWTVNRGMDGTKAATHNNGRSVALVTDSPLKGIYGASPKVGNATSGSQNWPWPNDGGTTLGNYLTSQVYVPSSTGNATARLLQTTDTQYQRIMRLYNWNYVVDNYNSSGSGANYPGTTPCDWRLRFFGTNDNTVLFNQGSNSVNGALNIPGPGSYAINYNEILRWIAASPNPFPQQLRAGRIKYYGSIPTQITGSWPNYGSTDQRFWKEFIDYVLGFRQTDANTYYDLTTDYQVYTNQMTGYGPDITWGNVTLNSPPSATQYMNYNDNPARPLLRHWFSPMQMVDFLHNMNISEQEPWYDPAVQGSFLMEPGDAYEAPSYSGKQAFLSAVNTMQTNNPNDWFSIVCYSGPRSSSSGWLGNSQYRGRFNCVRSPMGPNYNYARSALLFPFSTINADGSQNNTEITPYDADPATGAIPSADLVDTPRGDGDTCFAMGLMLAYNQFATTSPSDATLRSYVTSAPITFPTGMAGGLGRKGAQKVIIFETDGLANCTASANLVNAGSYKYYKIRYDMNKPNSSEYPQGVNMYGLNDPTVLNQVYSLVQQLANDYGSSRNPFRLYAIGFGPVFQGPDAAGALQTLQTMQYYAGTQSSKSTPLASNQIITGSDSQMLSNLTNTFTSILQDGIQIALIK